MPKLPKPVEFGVSHGIMTVVLSYTFKDSYRTLDCQRVYATWLFFVHPDASPNCLEANNSDLPYVTHVLFSNSYFDWLQ